MRAISAAAVCGVVLCGCATEPLPPPPAPPAAEERVEAKKGSPLIIEMALLPEPGAEPCPEAPATLKEYLNEIRECVELGAAAVRLQPMAPDSSGKDFRFDRSLDNYRKLLGEVLIASPDIIVDLDTTGAGDDVAEWVGCNGRIEFNSTGEDGNTLTAVSGESPLEVMKRVIDGGGHIRAGLAETRSWPYRRNPANLDFLRQALRMAREAGRPIAAPAEAREMLGLAPLRPLYAVPNRRSVRRGEKFFLDAIAAPVERPFVAYIVLQNPDGVRYSFTQRGRIVRGVRPYALSRAGTNRLIYNTIVKAKVGKGVLPGPHVIYLGLLPRRAAPRPDNAIALVTTMVTVQ